MKTATVLEDTGKALLDNPHKEQNDSWYKFELTNQPINIISSTPLVEGDIVEVGEPVNQVYYAHMYFPARWVTADDREYKECQHFEPAATRVAYPVKKLESEVGDKYINYPHKYEKFSDTTPPVVAEVKEEVDGWIRVEDAGDLLDATDPDLIVCYFDNGDIVHFNSDFSFALMTHIFILPNPPKAK